MVPLYGKTEVMHRDLSVNTRVEFGNTRFQAFSAKLLYKPKQASMIAISFLGAVDTSLLGPGQTSSLFTLK